MFLFFLPFFLPSCSAIDRNGAATLEITNSAENEDRLIILNAELKAASGSNIALEEEGSTKALNGGESVNFIIVAQVHGRTSLPEGSSFGEYGTSVSKYGSLSDIISGFIVMSGLLGVPEEKIEDYAFFAAPGKYVL